MTTGSILNEISNVRRSHVDRGYTIEHDNAHGALELIEVAKTYLVRSTVHGNRSDIIKAASVLVAAAETVDRLLSFEGVVHNAKPARDALVTNAICELQRHGNTYQEASAKALGWLAEIEECARLEKR